MRTSAKVGPPTRRSKSFRPPPKQRTTSPPDQDGTLSISTVFRPRSARAAPAPDSSHGASRSPPKSEPHTATSRIGGVRSQPSETRVDACWSWASRRRHTARIAPAGCSRAIVPATGCTEHFTVPASRANLPPPHWTTGWF